MVAKLRCFATMHDHQLACKLVNLASAVFVAIHRTYKSVRKGGIATLWKRIPLSLKKFKEISSKWDSLSVLVVLLCDRGISLLLKNHSH